MSSKLKDSRIIIGSFSAILCGLILWFLHANNADGQYSQQIQTLLTGLIAASLVGITYALSDKSDQKIKAVEDKFEERMQEMTETIKEQGIVIDDLKSQLITSNARADAYKERLDKAYEMMLEKRIAA